MGSWLGEGLRDEDSSRLALVGIAQDSQVCSPKCTQLDKPGWRWAPTCERAPSSTALPAQASPNPVGRCPKWSGKGSCRPKGSPTTVTRRTNRSQSALRVPSTPLRTSPVGAAGFSQEHCKLTLLSHFTEGKMRLERLRKLPPVIQLGSEEPV